MPCLRAFARLANATNTNKLGAGCTVDDSGSNLILFLFPSLPIFASFTLQQTRHHHVGSPCRYDIFIWFPIKSSNALLRCSFFFFSMYSLAGPALSWSPLRKMKGKKINKRQQFQLPRSCRKAITSAFIATRHL